ncbi:MAG: bifunctional 5,10-methylenetetrahydrofolate dehydrogenase/5,10-methenyltetrahydrofolate cyclohydrolase [Phycisphaeraceae bacterium]|nr:bifunctional 5,10-methylenetetrahydrofolate dehydrogenase/5,10-methenyltetrahydrofolate cyclohydrolase [Phycisphaeraceae bacterium]
MSATASATILDGRAASDEVRREVAARVAAAGRRVRLDAILVGDDRSALLYATNQAKTCADVGIEYVLHRLPAGASDARISARIELLNSEAAVHAIMLHLPLPEGIDTERMQALIDPHKDVEGVNPANIGNVVYGRRSLLPCTALAALELIARSGVTLRGARAVVVGASNIVGKPIAVLLMREEATVISTNRWTPDLASFTREAEVIVAAAGVAGLVTGEMLRPGAVVIDVGINRVSGPDGKLRTVGDVDFDSARRVAGHITPVPGGVGPMTVAMLLRNVVEAALRPPAAGVVTRWS